MTGVEVHCAPSFKLLRVAAGGDALTQRVRLLPVSAFLILAGLSACAPAPSAEADYPGVVQPPELSDAELADAREDQLRSLASILRVDPPPEVDLIRFVDSQEWVNTQISCAEEQGFTIERTPDGEGISALTVPPELRDQLNVVQYVCAAQYTLDPRTNVAMNGSQLKFLHWYYEIPFRACVEEAGYDAPRPPSQTTFIEEYTSTPWNPYQVMMEQGMPDSAMLELMTQCPQLPSTEQLWPRE